jgi:hypothetical protein
MRSVGAERFSGFTVYGIMAMHAPCRRRIFVFAMNNLIIFNFVIQACCRTVARKIVQCNVQLFAYFLPPLFLHHCGVFAPRDTTLLILQADD